MRKSAFALALLALLGPAQAAGVGPDVTISASNGTSTVTVIALSAATSTLIIRSNISRRGLRWMNIGLNPVTICPFTPAVVGQCFAYEPASSAGHQGGGDAFEAPNIPIDGFYGISTSGTTVIVWETN